MNKKKRILVERGVGFLIGILFGVSASYEIEGTIEQQISSCSLLIFYAWKITPMTD